MKKYFFYVLLLIFFSNIILHSQFGGGGPGNTKYNAYQIWNKAHLEELSDSLMSKNPDNSVFPPGRWIMNKHFKLMQNIDNVTNSVIGASSHHFYGNGKTITINSNYAFLGSAATIDSLILNGYIYR